MKTTRIDRRWIGSGAIALLLVATAGFWAGARGGSTPASPATDPHAAHRGHDGQGAPAADPHAGHGGMAGGDGTVRIDPATARSMGITVAVAELAPVSRTLRTTGHVTYDETRLTTISPRVGGFVERLHVDFTGQAVRRGQPLLEIYSPELVSAQEELLSAIRLERHLAASEAPGVAARSAGLVDAARRRLLLWDVSPAQVEQVERTGEVRRTMTLHAASSGFVVEKDVQQGQAVMPGMALYRLADLSSVWVEAAVYEQDLRLVTLGSAASVEIAAYPGERFAGRVSYVYPEVQAESRTTRMRVNLENPGGRIKPGMFASVVLDVAVAERAVLVPRDAVMRTGTHSMVFVEEQPGHYRMREVTVGVDSGGFTQVLSGILAGDRVVARANFILDAESRLMDGAMEGMDH
jgi:membrane fusion protein, copper/silver efflux system